MRSGFLESYPALSEEVKVDFAIMGGGIFGALHAWHLTSRGAKVALVDRRHIGMGSTAASTALLQYDIDKSLHELIGIVGEKKAVRAYEMSLQALLDLEKIAHPLDMESYFERRSSVYFAETEIDVPFLEKEYRTREKYGYEVELWDQKGIANRFPFALPAALYRKPGGIVDPYRLTHGLLRDAVKNGLLMFDTTEALSIEHRPDGITLHTSQGYRIEAKKLVIACGYESPQ